MDIFVLRLDQMKKIKTNSVGNATECERFLHQLSTSLFVYPHEMPRVSSTSDSNYSKD